MQTQTNSPRAFSVAGFCKTYAIGRTFMYEEIAKGRLRTRKAGRRTLILKDDADSWLASLPAGGPNKQAA